MPRTYRPMPACCWIAAVMSMPMCACAILPFLIKGVEQGSRPGRTSGRGPVQPRQRAGRRDADAAAAARCGKRLKRRDGVWAVDFAQRLDDHKLQAKVALRAPERADQRRDAFYMAHRAECVGGSPAHIADLVAQCGGDARQGAARQFAVVVFSTPLADGIECGDAGLRVGVVDVVEQALECLVHRPAFIQLDRRNKAILPLFEQMRMNWRYLGTGVR